MLTPPAPLFTVFDQGNQWRQGRQETSTSTSTRMSTIRRRGKAEADLGPCARLLEPGKAALVDTLVDTLVHRILDQIGLPAGAAFRWFESPELLLRTCSCSFSSSSFDQLLTPPAPCSRFMIKATNRGQGGQETITSTRTSTIRRRGKAEADLGPCARLLGLVSQPRWMILWTPWSTGFSTRWASQQGSISLV